MASYFLGWNASGVDPSRLVDCRNFTSLGEDLVKMKAVHVICSWINLIAAIKTSPIPKSLLKSYKTYY